MVRERYYKDSRKYREHEMQLAMINWLAKDPDAKYFLGVMGGAGVAIVGAALTTDPRTQGYEKAPSVDPNSEAVLCPACGESVSKPEHMKEHMKAAHPLDTGETLALMFIKSDPALRTVVSMAVTGAELTGAMNITKQIGALLTVSGTSFSAFCAAILLIKAIVGEGGLGDILKGIGEIVPG